MKTAFYLVLSLVLTMGLFAVLAPVSADAIPWAELSAGLSMLPVIGMAKQNRWSRIGQLDYVSGGVKSLDLPRAMLYHYLSLRLSGTVDIITAVTTAWADAPWSLMRRLEVVVDGKDTLKSVDMEFLRIFNRLYYGTDPNASAMPTAVAAGQAFNAQAILPFEMPRSVRPIDSLIESGRFSTFQLVGTWGTSNSVYSANPANATILAATNLEVGAMQAFGIQGRFAVHKNMSIVKDVTAITPEFQILLPVGNLYRAFLIKAVNYGAAPANVDPGTGSNAILNEITLKSGTEVFFKQKAAQIQDDNKRMFGVEAWPAGWYIIDFSQDGLMTESLDARALSQLEMILDVANPATTNKVKVYPIELIVPPTPLNG